ncbi:hypothetical protein NHQ30_011020 [Ciborinia camelliae]|nr:hypothetical protein NHQ30_011020 [Ciborinia camelliae]
MAANPGLLGYLDRNADAPPPTPSPQLPAQERASRHAIANKLRVSKKQRPASANMNRAHNPEHASEQPAGFPQRNTVHGGHQTYPQYEQEQEQEQEQQNRDKFDTSTVGDDFDYTVSQENFSSGQNMAGVDVNDEYNRRVPDEAGQDEYYQAAQYHNGDDRDPRDDSDLGNDYSDGAPVTHHLQTTLYQNNGQGPHPQQALGASIWKHSQTPKPVIQSQPQKPAIQAQASQLSPTKHKIAGRFNPPRPGQVDTLANRPKNGIQTIETSRKRVFDEGVFSPLPKVGKSSQVVESLENAIPLGLAPYNIPPPRTQNMQPAQIDEVSDDEEYSDESHIDEQPALQSRPVDRLPTANLQHQNGNLNLASIELDYDDATLKKMKYNQLRDESFEATPAACEQSSEPDMSLSERTLSERVSYHVEQPRSSDGQDTDKQRTAMAEFFGNLSQDEWEEAGDWFLERFAETLRSLKDAKIEKRNAVARFEKEIEQRERDVRGSLQAYHEDMERMKRGAKGVIEGKTI